ncbi:MAG: heavy metal sensor histidine kinase [Janthinobacterium lividum]
MPSFDKPPFTRQFSRLSLTTTLALAFAGTTFAVFALVGSVLYFELARQVNTQDDLDIVLAARHSRRLAEELDSTDEVRAHLLRLRSTVLGNRALSISIFDARGATLLSYNAPEQSAAPTEQQALAHPRGPQVHLTEADIVAWRARGGAIVRSVATEATLHDGTRITLLIARDMSDRHKLLDTYRDRLKLAGVAGVLLAFLIGYWLVKASLAPLRDMTRSAASVTTNRLDVRIDVGRAPPEVSALGASLNAMLLRLDTGFQRLSQFTTDLAHDLRTPLSNMRGATEVALSRPRSPEEYQILLASNLEECERLSRMIENVLFLGRAEHPQFAMHAQDVDIRRELDRIAAYFEGLAEDGGVQLHIDAAGTVKADVDLFRRAVSNLLANAVRYTPRGGAISLRTRASDAELQVIVANEGQMIAPQYLERIFDRFYRIDPSRHNQPVSPASAGLGLAIVRTIMELHRGRAYAESDAHSTRFVLAFPREPGRGAH